MAEAEAKEVELDLNQRETNQDQWNLVGNVEELKAKRCRKLYVKAENGGNLALFYVAAKDTFYVTNSACPHARGPLEQGDIEEVHGAYRIVCPLHYYSFDLETGKSPTGLVVAVYRTEVRGDDLYALTPHPVSLTRW